ncbi:hypothetical protein BDP81DRAFT_408463 [Colletotrichum phormii]|uniref:Uncharacterized protein n=1 Tax=Colletotrichum phormii TaxID=359342 RepID=A0AAI9ZL70_9PEZI|nr:uncharacterized protein BDP81DRAFT_408463 [Colletotrichum phormii]KAK1633964.1 hypothetical protein BDP81DRAFT_408463 [Colletotrichum phormii]
MHSLFDLILLLLLATSTAALPATPATPTNPPPTSTSSPDTQRPPIQPFLPTTGAALLPTGIPASPRPNPNNSPAPSPIYSTLTPKFPPSNSSSSPSGHHNSTSPCASGRPLRLGPARLHKNPHNRTSSSSSSSSPSPPPPPSTTTPTEAAVAAAAIAAAAVETPTDGGPRNYASLIPPAPGVTPRPEPNLAEMGYYQTTYYSCATRGTSTHCGWHRPIMVAPANNAGTGTSVNRKAGIGALAVAVVGVLVAG